MSRSLLGAVLAGGMSRRMGTPKATLRLPDGRKLLEAAASALSPICGRLVMVGGNPGWLNDISVPLRYLPDIHPGEGPLAGIETALTAGDGWDCLVVGCDQPLLTTTLLLRLVVGRSDRPRVFAEPGLIHPLPGYYPASLLPQAVSAMGTRMRSLHALLATAAVESIILDIDDLSLIQSLNTPEQFATFTGFLSLQQQTAGWTVDA